MCDSYLVYLCVNRMSLDAIVVSIVFCLLPFFEPTRHNELSVVVEQKHRSISMYNIIY